MDQEILQALRQVMQEELKPVIERLDRIEGDIDELKETVGELRTGVNHLTEWADECGYVIKFPLPKV